MSRKNSPLAQRRTLPVLKTLSQRGSELAAGPSLRDRFGVVLRDSYHSETNAKGFINIGTAENYSRLPVVKQYIQENCQIQARDFSYGDGPWGSDRLREAMAKHMTVQMNALVPVAPEDLLFANGVTSLCEMLGFTIADPGDGILFSRPIYQAFQSDFGQKAKVRSIFVHFDEVDQFSPAAVDKYEEALLEIQEQGVRIRGLMLCNPHNPLGKCYPKDTIIALMKLCNKHKIHLLSDEIYAASVYNVPDKDALPFTSVLSFDYSEYIDSNYLHVIYGLSKDFAAGGLRLGCIYIQNKDLMRAMCSITQFHWSGGPSQQIATTLLEDEKWLAEFLEESRHELAEANKYTRKLLDDAGIEYYSGANAGFFLWVDLRPYLPPCSPAGSRWDGEQQLMNKLMESKVYITNGQMLAAEEPGWFRVIFSVDKEVIKAGLERVFKVIGIGQ